MLHEKRSTARGEVLGVQTSGVSSINMPNKGGTPSKGRSAAREEGGV